MCVAFIATNLVLAINMEGPVLRESLEGLSYSLHQAVIAPPALHQPRQCLLHKLLEVQLESDSCRHQTVSISPDRWGVLPIQGLLR